MGKKLDAQLRERVFREKMSHTNDDVNEKGWRLKRLFPHVITSLTMLRFKNDYNSYLVNVDSLHILDIGCGRGDQSLMLLNRGAKVTGIDISESYIASVLQLVKKGGIDKKRYKFIVMDAHSLAFADQSFDLVVGRGILHHLNLKVSLNEIRRVLKKDGRALFHEPLSANPLFKIFRIITPYARTKDEKPLSTRDLEWIENDWNSQNTYYGVISAPIAVITSILLKPFENNLFLRIADHVEKKINEIPIIRPYNQYVLLSFLKK